MSEFECDFCGMKFKSKSKFIEHIEKDLAEARDMEANAIDGILECERILKELEHAEKPVKEVKK